MTTVVRTTMAHLASLPPLRHCLGSSTGRHWIVVVGSSSGVPASEHALASFHPPRLGCIGRCLADVLPPYLCLFWRMLCRRCRIGADAWPPWFGCFGGCFATLSSCGSFSPLMRLYLLAGLVVWSPVEWLSRFVGLCVLSLLFLLVVGVVCVSVLIASTY